MSSGNVVDLIKKGVTDVFYEEIFPNEFIEDNFIIRSDGNLAAGFLVSLPEKESLREENIFSLQKSLELPFSTLPVGTVVHFQSQFYHSENGLRALEDSAKGYITTKMRQHLGDRAILENKVIMYLIFNFSDEKLKNPASTFFSNIRRIFKNPLANVERNKVLAKSYIQSCLTQLNAIDNFTVTPLNDIGLIQEKLRYFNLKFEKTPTAYTSTIENRGNEVAVGSELVRTVFLRKTGNQLYNSKLNDREVISFMPWTMGHYLSFPHLVNYSFMICNSEKEMKKLEVSRNIRKALGSLQKQVDRMIIRDIDEFTEDVRESNKGLVYMNHNVMTWDTDPKRLSLKVDIVKTAYQQMNGSIGLDDAYNAGNYFFTFSPGGALDMFSSMLMPLEEAILHFDFSRPPRTENRGIIMCTRELEPLLVDLWSEELPNRNRIVIGPSGSGKSFTMNAILSQEIDQGVELVILDVGGSYKNLYSLNSNRGRYYEYNVQSPFSSNPFLISKDRHGQWNLAEDKIIFLLTFITLMWKDTKKGEALSKEEESVITRLLGLYFSELNRSEELPRLDRFVSFVKKYAESNQGHPDFAFFKIDSFVLVLEKFTTGNYSKAVNSDDNENIANHPLIVFDLAGIQSDPILYPIVSLIIVELVLDKIRTNPKVRKEIVIDEAWTMLQGALAQFIENLYRTIRKSNGAVTIVTQSVIELKSSPVGQAIKANAATKILLDHNSQVSLIPELQEFFGLTNHEIGLLKSVRKRENFREMLIGRASVHQVFAIDVGPHAGVAFSSWNEDRSEISKLTKVGGPEYAINQFIENKKTGSL